MQRPALTQYTLPEDPDAPSPWGECGYVASIRRWLREKWRDAIDDDGLRARLIGGLEAMRGRPIGEAADGLAQLDIGLELGGGWPDFRDTLNLLPRRLHAETIEHVIGALREGMLLDLLLFYSTNGAMGIEVRTCYSDGSLPTRDDVTPVREIRIVCPPLNTPIIDVVMPPIS
jgi:hypothetical protein